MATGSSHKDVPQMMIMKMSSAGSLGVKTGFTRKKEDKRLSTVNVM